jgi:hypothetical protein
MFLEYFEKKSFHFLKKISICRSALDPAGMRLIQQKSSWIENAAGLQSLIRSVPGRRRNEHHRNGTGTARRYLKAGRFLRARPLRSRADK